MARRDSQFQISWMTISYRSVLLAVIVVLALAGAGIYILFPKSAPVLYALQLRDKALAKLMPDDKDKTHVAGPQQAHFTALEGTVKVKKASSNSWVNADYNLPLEKGDVVQTSSEGMARLVFEDGTNYTVKQDSLIVIEENSTNAARQTDVAVQVTTGTVDLATATYTEGSSSRVIVAGASAALAPDTAAIVRNDPRSDKSEILVRRGSGAVTRGQQTVVLTDYEKVSFRSTTTELAKVKEAAPPTLISPANAIPVHAEEGKGVQFAWTPIPASHGYRVRISRNPYMTQVVYDKTVAVTEVRVPLKEGQYWWTVNTIDINGKQSIDSEHNAFAVLAKPTAVTVALELQPFVQHGRVVEVKGRTEPNARVLVNGQYVPMVSGDGTFRYFTPQMASGEHTITITSQNAKGGSRTEQRRVVID